jgi:hypothetical protein
MPRPVENWTRLGICGVRLNMMSPLVLPLTDLESIGAYLKDFGWHLSLLVETPDRLAEIETTLSVIGCKAIVEHDGANEGGSTANCSRVLGAAEVTVRQEGLGEAFPRLSHLETGPAALRGHHGTCARPHRGRAGSHGVGIRLAACPDAWTDAGRRLSPRSLR